jgi:hypothetical protein
MALDEQHFKIFQQIVKGGVLSTVSAAPVPADLNLLPRRVSGAQGPVRCYVRVGHLMTPTSIKKDGHARVL